MCNTVYCGLINININTDVQALLYTDVQAFHALHVTLGKYHQETWG